MTEQEQKTMDVSAELWNRFLQLPGGHPDDVMDMKFHIHAIQRIIASRPYLRAKFPPHGSPVMAEVIRQRNEPGNDPSADKLIRTLNNIPFNDGQP